METIILNCKICYYEEESECRRFPPTNGIRDTRPQKGLWLAVSDNGWCGEFKMDEDKLKKRKTS